MTNCCVPKCKNSSAKSYLLKCFPRDDKRRTEWIKNINRPNWFPNHSHRVCEVHFKSNMWEKTRVDGSRKLKHDAVPTVFGDDIKKQSSISTMVPSTEKMNTDIEKTPSTHNQIDTAVSSKKTKYIKIIPQTLLNSLQKTPVLIPVSSILNSQMVKPLMNPINSLIVDNKGRIIKNSASVKPGTANILMSHTKTSGVQTHPMMISSDANVLRNQIKASNSQTPIFVPATTGIFKSSMTTSNATSSILSNINPQLKVANTKPVLSPVISES